MAVKRKRKRKQSVFGALGSFVHGKVSDTKALKKRAKGKSLWKAKRAEKRKDKLPF